MLIAYAKSHIHRMLYKTFEAQVEPGSFHQFNFKLHKEKEMVDSRKWLIAFAALALLVAFGSTANAQTPIVAPGFTCVANAGNPVIVRTEGITELVGDLLLQCTGGVPTPAGRLIPQTNVTATLNTNITSRLLGSGYIDALLLIDEPYPVNPATNQNPVQAQIPTPAGAPTQIMCRSNTTGPGSTPANCNAETGTFNGVGFGLAGSAPTPYQSQANVFVARQAAANQVTWLGVPIDAPGTNFVRTVRITNVRANACQLGLSSTLIPTQIVMFISLNGSQAITINNPQQTVAFIQQGLVVSSSNGNLIQCNNLNVGGGGNGNNFFGGAVTGDAEAAVNLREGFAASFKRRDVPITTATGIGLNGVAEGVQNVPGFAYNTESGLQPQTAIDGATGLGLADFATRFRIQLNNVGVGVRVIFPIAVPLTTGNSTAVGAPTLPSNVTLGTGVIYTGGFIRLIGGTSDSNGNFPSNTFGFAAGTTTFSQTPNNPFGSFGQFGSNPFKGPGFTAPFNQGVELTGTGGTITAIYEVVNADPAAVEQANVPIGVAFISNTAQNLPAPGTTTVNASFAPLSTVNTADGSAPIPRFCDQSVARNLFAIVICQCNLLFPFVTNQAGFDTGIALANTSLDPYGTTPQSGTVTLNYYGNTVGGGQAPPAQKTSSVVPGGQELIFTLSNGGNFGIAATPGFQGYIIAVSNFQFCHAFAFISDVGALRLAEGYVAIQLDIPGLNRTGIIGENEGH
jgi:hypothetical protein